MGFLPRLFTCTPKLPKSVAKPRFFNRKQEEFNRSVENVLKERDIPADKTIEDPRKRVEDALQQYADTAFADVSDNICFGIIEKNALSERFEGEHDRICEAPFAFMVEAPGDGTYFRVRRKMNRIEKDFPGTMAYLFRVMDSLPVMVGTPSVMAMFCEYTHGFDPFDPDPFAMAERDEYEDEPWTEEFIADWKKAIPDWALPTNTAKASRPRRMPKELGRLIRRIERLHKELRKQPEQSWYDASFEAFPILVYGFDDDGPYYATINEAFQTQMQIGNWYEPSWIIEPTKGWKKTSAIIIELVHSILDTGFVIDNYKGQ